jgi:hypothetical protein
MNPKIWGASGWLFIHSIALNYPDNPTKNEKNAIKDFLKSLKYLLPCKTCSELYIKDFPLIEKQIPLNKASENKTNLIKWVNLMHNQVNKNINKKTYSDEEYNNYYNNLYNDSTNQNYYFYILIVLFVISIIYIILK